jgi:hypothetical protein
LIFGQIGEKKIRQRVGYHKGASDCCLMPSELFLSNIMQKISYVSMRRFLMMFTSSGLARRLVSKSCAQYYDTLMVYFTPSNCALILRIFFYLSFQSLRVMGRLMKECWYHNAAARLTTHERICLNK